MYKDIIRVFDNTLPPEFCEELIEMYDNHPKKHQGTCGNNKIDLRVKNTIDLFISNKPDLKRFDTKLHETLMSYTAQYLERLEEQTTKKNWSFFPFETNGMADDGYNMKRYEINEGRFNWHRDDKVTTSGVTRNVAIIWYLNDVQEGGYTEFFDGTKIQPAQGRLLMFPATWTFGHQGVPPVSNPKYIITSFLTWQAYEEYWGNSEATLRSYDNSGGIFYLGKKF